MGPLSRESSVSVVQLRQEGDALPPLLRVQGLGTPDPKVVEASGQRLWVETSESAGSKEVVEGGCNRGRFRVSGGRVLAAGWDCEVVQGGWRRGRGVRGGEGGPGPP